MTRLAAPYQLRTRAHINTAQQAIDAVIRETAPTPDFLRAQYDLIFQSLEDAVRQAHQASFYDRREHPQPTEEQSA